MYKREMIQCNKHMNLEDSMVMYGIYNAETLEKLIDTVYNMHSITTPTEKTIFRTTQHSIGSANIF